MKMLRRCCELKNYSVGRIKECHKAEEDVLSGSQEQIDRQQSTYQGC